MDFIFVPDKSIGGAGGDNLINEEKMNEILQSVQGITYLEWRKLSHSIEQYFNNEATMQGNKIIMASPEILINLYKRLF